MNNMDMQRKITVYFDGLCKLCSKEINHYKKQKGSHQIHFIDICSGHFDAKKEGLDPYLVHKIMHVRRADGTMATRVDAFIEIWKYLPRYYFLAQWSQNSILKKIMEFGYSGFTVVRPYLPRYSNNSECQDSPYCETKNV